MNDTDHPNVMVSSTYSDLTEHRKEAIDALLRLGFFPVGMEFDAAKAGKDVIASSLEMVDKAAAYVGIVSHRYGGVPKDPTRNPKKLSITELEYRGALERGIPVYMFLMSNQHPVRIDGVEKVKANSTKLAALKEDAKERSICAEFSSALELKSLILQSCADLRTKLDHPAASPDRRAERDIQLPQPPDLLAVPDFVSGHQFVGRNEELDELDRWAASSESLFVIEAIGGAGKSALAWHWMKTRAKFAGTLWYSFYEGGSDMAAFAAYALSYTTGRPLRDFRGKHISALAPDLLFEIHSRPCLFVLDGLERVLVAYNRIDASQARDDQVESETEHRACIKPQDADLLYRLVAAAPSKILVTSRLMPSALANAVHQPLPGVRHLNLRGMHPGDAMRMMRDLGVHGDEQSMRRYFKDNFDNHPLVLGIVAGLVTDYVRAPGNFDRWADDPQGGAALHLATLDLKKRRTHILASALNGLEPGERQVLSRIAALPDAVAFETVEALSPFKGRGEAISKLVTALHDLERRGLLQWDRAKNSYDLHPVVRGYAFDALGETEKADISNQIVDHFESKPEDRYDNAKALADLQQSINIFRALVQAGRLDDAASFYRGAFSYSLLFSVEAYLEILKLLKPLFPDGFQNPPRGVTRSSDRSNLLNNAGIVLEKLDRNAEAEAAYAAGLRIYLEDGDGNNARTVLSNLALGYANTSPARSIVGCELVLELTEALRDQDAITLSHLDLMWNYASVGLFGNAETAYAEFQKRPTPVTPGIYWAGSAERYLCWLRFYQGTLTDQLLRGAELVAKAGNNRLVTRDLYWLRGELALHQGNLPEAIAGFEQYIEMTQTAGMSAADVEGRLALAIARKGDVEHARRISDKVQELTGDVNLAELYLEVGHREQARQRALTGYKSAWADGPEYPRWWALKRCRAVLAALGEPEPKLPAYDPKTAKPIPHEADIRALIAKLKSEHDHAQ
jgi:tetratricopeptide (TPR) repeat protein